jgi:hypothetical protein
MWMSEKQIPNPETKKAGGEKPPSKDPRKTAQDLGKTALRGTQK